MVYMRLQKLLETHCDLRTCSNRPETEILTDFCYVHVRQGAFFDPTSMQPLVNNAAMARAMQIYQQLQLYTIGDQDSSCAAYNKRFVMGECEYLVKLVITDHRSASGTCWSFANHPPPNFRFCVGIAVVHVWRGWTSVEHCIMSSKQRQWLTKFY